MLSEFKRTTNIAVGVGFVLFLIGRPLELSQSSPVALLGSVMLLAALGFFVWGSSQYARGKGHSPYWGILGLIFPLGFVILFFLRDRHKATTVS